MLGCGVPSTGKGNTRARGDAVDMVDRGFGGERVCTSKLSPGAASWPPPVEPARCPALDIEGTGESGIGARVGESMGRVGTTGSTILDGRPDGSMGLRTVSTRVMRCFV